MAQHILETDGLVCPFPVVSRICCAMDGASWDWGSVGQTPAGTRPGAADVLRGAMKSLAAAPVPRIMTAKLTQPCHSNAAVATRALPMVQPPAHAAPTPMRAPPPMSGRWSAHRGPGA